MFVLLVICLVCTFLSFVGGMIIFMVLPLGFGVGRVQRVSIIHSLLDPFAYKPPKERTASQSDLTILQIRCGTLEKKGGELCRCLFKILFCMLCVTTQDCQFGGLFGACTLSPCFFLDSSVNSFPRGFVRQCGAGIVF